MAEEKDEKQKEQDGKSEKKSSNLILWIIIAVVVIGASAGGFLAAKIATGPVAEAEPEEVEKIDDQAEKLLAKEAADNDWTYSLPSTIANLDEPGASRYVRAEFNLLISAELDTIKGTEFFDSKKSEINDQLLRYLAGKTLEEVRGRRNQDQMKLEIRDFCNNMFFKDSKPYVKDVLIQTFNIQ